MRVRCLAQEHNTTTRPGLEPGSLDPESSALTTRPPRLPPMGGQTRDKLQSSYIKNTLLLLFSSSIYCLLVCCCCCCLVLLHYVFFVSPALVKRDHEPHPVNDVRERILDLVFEHHDENNCLEGLYFKYLTVMLSYHRARRPM